MRFLVVPDAVHFHKCRFELYDRLMPVAIGLLEKIWRIVESLLEILEESYLVWAPEQDDADDYISVNREFWQPATYDARRVT